MERVPPFERARMSCLARGALNEFEARARKTKLGHRAVIKRMKMCLSDGNDMRSFSQSRRRRRARRTVFVIAA